MNRLLDALAQLMLALWVGGLWAIGYLAAPSLFYHLQDKQLAGLLAGEMFVLIAYVGMVAGFYLLLHRLLRQGTFALRQGAFWITLCMLLLILAGHFGIDPVLARLKAQAMPADVMHSVFADRFRAWHGISSIAYLAESLLGAWLVLKLR